MSELQFLSQVIDAKADRIKSLAREIWGYAELAYEEEKSAAALEQALASEGFTIEKGIADIPTAFTATFVSGSGKPVAAILGEYDARKITRFFIRGAGIERIGRMRKHSAYTVSLGKDPECGYIFHVNGFYTAAARIARKKLKCVGAY